MTSRNTYGLFDFIGDLGGLNEALFLIGVFITNYWSKAGAYRYAWHSLYYTRGSTDKMKLSVSKDDIVKAQGVQDLNPEKLDNFKTHMKESFTDRERVYSLKFPILYRVYMDLD